MNRKKREIILTFFFTLRTEDPYGLRIHFFQCAKIYIIFQSEKSGVLTNEISEEMYWHIFDSHGI